MNQTVFKFVETLVACFSFACASLALATPTAAQCDPQASQIEESIQACSREIDSGQLTGSDLADAYRKRGLMLQKRGEIDAAISDYGQALVVKPDYIDALMNRAAAYVEKGIYDTARFDYDRVLDTHPSNVNARSQRSAAWLTHCYVALSDDEPATAITLCTRAIDSEQLTKKDLAVALVNRGSVFGTLDKPERALADYESAIHADPAYAQAYIARGQYYRLRGQESKAIADFDRAIAIPIHAAYPMTYLWRARAYISKGLSNLAMADLNVLLRLVPKHREAHLDRAQLFENTYMLTRAIADFDELLRLDPGDVAVHRRRANAYMNLGNVQQAQNDFDAVIAMRPHVPDGYLRRAVFNLRRGEPDLAIADCSQAIQLEPSRSSHRVARANAYSQRGDWKLAIQDLLYAVHADPGRAIFRSNLAATREYQGDWLVALVDREEAVRLEPGNANWRVNRAWTLMNLGRTEEALSGFADAINLDPGAPLRYIARGLAQLRLGHYDDAAADFKKSIEINPARGLSYVNLANVSIYRGEPLAGLAHLKLVHEQVPDFEADDNRGFLRLAAGQIDDAISDYSVYINQRPDAASGFGGRGLAEFMRQDYRDAFDDFSRYVALRPLDSMAMIMLDLTRTRLGLPAPNDTADLSGRFDPRKWPAPLFRFAHGDIKAAALIKAAADTSVWQTRIQEAQAYLIAGEYDLANNRRQEARQMFTEVIARQLPADWSTLIARTELARLNSASDTPKATNNRQQADNQ